MSTVLSPNELIHEFNIHEFDIESNYESDAPKQVASNHNIQIECKNINLQQPDNGGKNMEYANMMQINLLTVEKIIYFASLKIYSHQVLVILNISFS